MELDGLKKQVYEANMLLVKHNLTAFTWGNVSGIDREKNIIVIKPSGVEFDKLSPENMVVLNLDGKVLSQEYRPSSDTPTHLELYKSFPEIGGIVHTHSKFATAFAQAKKSVKAYGTTHADFSHGDIPCTRPLNNHEIKNEYEKNTALVILEHFKNNELDFNAIPGALVSSHGPFTWGKDPMKALENAAILEIVCEIAYYTETLSHKTAEPIPKTLLDKHYYRKHGERAYYGQ